MSTLSDLSAKTIMFVAVASFSIAPIYAKAKSKTKKPITIKSLAKKTALSGDGAPELTEKASKAIDQGLEYLISIQKNDGSWDSDGKGGRVIANTSLAMMAFMANAQFPGFGKYGKQLDLAKDFMMKKAKARKDGYLGGTMYEHGLATLALSEIWGMTKAKEDDDDVQKALEAAVDVIKRSQNPGGGWRYQPAADGGEDTSVTAMVFIALASARQAGVLVQNEVIAKFRKYVKHARDGKTGGFSYAPNGNGGTSIPCTAGLAYAGQLAGMRGTEEINGAIRLLNKQENIFNNVGHFYYCHYYAIQAMVQTSDEQYGKWYPKIRDSLILKQNTSGSWGKKEKYATPIAIIILSTPHRYIPIYQR